MMLPRRPLWVAVLVLLGTDGPAPAAAESAVDEAARWIRAGDAPARLAAARALWRAGQRSSATRRYLELLLAGEAPAAEAAERLLADPGLPVEDQRLPELLLRDLPALRGPLRVRLWQRVAMQLLRRGDHAAAEAALSRAVELPTARYLRAVLRLRRDRDAARLDLLEVTRGGATGARDLAQLALARLDREAGDLGTAASRYASISPTSESFFRARQELAWVHLEQGQPGPALAQSVTLAAPAWRRFYRPDRELVEAAALLALCRERPARIRATLGRGRLSSVAAELSSFLRERPDRRLYYVEAVQSAAGRGPLSTEVAAAVLADAGFHRAFQLVRQLQHERRLLHRDDGASLRAVLGTELDERLVVVQRRSGLVVQRLLTDLRAELLELRLRIDELLFDLESRGQPAPRAERSEPPEPPASSSPASGRQQRWVFQGEYWLDEQRDVVVRLPSRCR